MVIFLTGGHNRSIGMSHSSLKSWCRSVLVRARAASGSSQSMTAAPKAPCKSYEHFDGRVPGSTTICKILPSVFSSSRKTTLSTRDNREGHMSIHPLFGIPIGYCALGYRHLLVSKLVRIQPCQVGKVLSPGLENEEGDMLDNW
jgi:hypothetical protein